MDPKAEGVACTNRDCPYNDKRHKSHCKATTRAGGSWVVGCNQYLPDPIDLVAALNSPRPKPDMACVTITKTPAMGPTESVTARDHWHWTEPNEAIK